MLRWFSAHWNRVRYHLRFAFIRQTGDEGERTAEIALMQEGYRLLARNFTLGKDEADLVLESPDRAEVVVVEVKRSARGFDASERVDRRKLLAQGRILRFIARHLRKQRPVRLDIMAVTGTGRDCKCLRHIKGVLRHEACTSV